jgi:LPS-assembly lipoprotein
MRSSTCHSVRAAAAVLLVVAIMSGCGFQLRGAASLPPEFQEVSLRGVDVYSELGDALRALLEANGSRVVEPDVATGVLWILDEAFRKDVTALGSNGKAVEFRLAYRVRFKAEDAAGNELVAPDEVRLFRDYAYAEDQVLGRNAAEEDVQRQLIRESAWMVLQRLQALPAT